MKKAIPYLGWITLGALIGLILVQFIGSGHQPVPAASADHTQRRPLGRLEIDRAKPSVYNSLPDLPGTTLGYVIEQLHDASSAKSPARHRADLMRLLLERAAEPGRAAEVVQQLQESATAANDHSRIISEIYKQWAAGDPTAAMDALADLKGRRVLAAAMRGALEVWAVVDPDAALDYVKTAELEMVAEDGASIALRALAEVDPGRALETAREFGDSDLERSLHRLVIKKMAEADMPKAWAEIEQLGDAALKRELQDSAIRGLANSDRAAALTYADQLTDRDRRRFHIREIFNLWPLRDAEGAKEAFLNYPSDGLLDGAAFAFGQTMNLASSQEALDFSNSLKAGVRDQYLLGVLTEQAIKQPVETAAIVDQHIGNDEDLARVYRHLGESWAGKDEHAAAAWLSDLPESAARDQAVSAFSDKLFSMDPERAVQWAVTIRDEKERANRVEKLLRQWTTRDPGAASGWLDRSGYE